MPPMNRLAPLLLLTACTMGRADDRPEARTLSVGGRGRISAAPNAAEITVGVVTQAETAREALSANSQKMAALQKALKDRGVAAKDIQTSNIGVSPRYSQPQPQGPGLPPVEFTPRLVGYDVTNMVTITARDLARLGELLDAAVAAGANQMHGIGFRVDGADALLDDARKRAMADARRKAELLAGEAGMVLGPPMSIVDEPSPPSSPPMPMMGMMMKSAESVPIAPGEQELVVNLRVVYELRLPK